LFASARGSAIRATQCQQACETQRSANQFQKEARMFIQVARSYTKRSLKGLQSSPLDCSHYSEAHINQLAHLVLQQLCNQERENEFEWKAGSKKPNKAQDDSC